jgi:heme o synthase
MSMNKSTIRSYYRLTKPGIIYGNALMYAAGFFLASREGIEWPLFLFGLVGLSLVIAAACVFNNVADRELDAKMERTKNRALVRGAISIPAANKFAAILLLLGFSSLYFFTSDTAFLIALVGFVVYVHLYTPMKPKNRWALFVGAVAGATPPVVGYTAVTDSVDLWALGLFIALFVWQLPHFIAIATYRYEDYSLAGVPLFARAPKNDKERKLAKRVFFISLIILLLGCLSIFAWRIYTLTFASGFL